MKMLTEWISGSVMPNSQVTLQTKYLKAKFFLKMMGALACASVVAGEYFLTRVAFRYLNENLGFSDDIASLLISLFFFLQALVLFSCLSYQLKSIESFCEDRGSIRKIISSFISGFKSGS